MLKKSELKSKTKLVAKAPLKTKTQLTAKTPVAKQPKQHTVSWWHKKADKSFSRYVRLRDSERRGSEWYGTCITCSYTARVAWTDETQKLRLDRNWDAGHYISRGYHVTRFEEENVNLQCSFRCNRMRSGEHEKYKLALEMKYGDGVPERLEEMIHQSGKRPHKIKQLQQIIHDAEESIKYYEQSTYI